VIADCFNKYTDDIDAVARHYLHTSDILAFREIGYDNIAPELSTEVDSLYGDWMFDQKKYAEHYAGGTEQMYDSEAFHYETEDFKQHPRFLEVARFINENLTDGATVLDYGCAHGMFTNYLAQVFPNVNFIGVDVSSAAIEQADKKAVELKLDNVAFHLDDWLDTESLSAGHFTNCDMLILGEILEHVPDPVDFMETVSSVVGTGTHIVITTPIGPWESLSYEKEYPKRYHLHHYERSDLQDMFGHHEDFAVNCLPASHIPSGELLGWYITKFALSGTEAAKPIDYARKLSETKPRQTVSFCGIVKNGEDSLLKMLKSVEPYVDEVILGIDETSTDHTQSAIDAFEIYCENKRRSPAMAIKVSRIPSPVEIGFDAARNLVLEQATKHWIMWADSDEEFVSGERVTKYLRQNCWNGYGIPQHHFSVEPLAVLSTDYPVRLFRRHDDVRFRGVVHEHPENKNNPDDGVGFAYVLFDLHFAHNGYTTEDIRRKRFMRNISLMARDREQNPDRILGRFLWIRDLALMCRFDLEKTGGNITQQMHERAAEGLRLWEETVDASSDHPQVRRMIKDHLEFYDTLVKVLNQGFDFKINLGSGNGNAEVHLNPATELKARFLNRRHLDKFLSVVIDEEVKDYGTKYN